MPLSRGTVRTLRRQQRDLCSPFAVAEQKPPCALGLAEHEGLCDSAFTLALVVFCGRVGVFLALPKNVSLRKFEFGAGQCALHQ